MRKTLKTLLSQPTAPYREAHVQETIETLLSHRKSFRDPVGNILVGPSSKADFLKMVKTKTNEPLRIFISHMDHPGFHGIRWKGPKELEVKWFGGGPSRLLKGAKVWTATNQGWLINGKFHSIKLGKRFIDTATVKFSEELKLPAKEIFGGLGFRAPLWYSGKKLYTKAADDLVGVSTIVEMARKQTPKHWVGLLTRAEEVGFIGTIGFLELGWLKAARRPIVFVVLEASRTLPNAEVGKGPIVRLGDRITVYNPDLLCALEALAKKAGPYQKRIMDGGACEASPATAYGFPAVGISVPLGNYHNEGFEGGQDCRGPRGPAPEFVHEDDIKGMLKLCQAIIKPGALTTPWKPQQQRFKKAFSQARPLLRSLS